MMRTLLLILLLASPAKADNIRLSWAEFKSSIFALELPIFFSENGVSYHVVAPWMGGTFSVRLTTNTAASDEFVSDFLPDANNPMKKASQRASITLEAIGEIVLISCPAGKRIVVRHIFMSNQTAAGGQAFKFRFGAGTFRFNTWLRLGENIPINLIDHPWSGGVDEDFMLDLQFATKSSITVSYISR